LQYILLRDTLLFQIARNCFSKEIKALIKRKPVGFKICIGRQDEFIDIIKAMKETVFKPILLQLTEQKVELEQHL
jgi:hypothetical protein